jgi:hypothetical protein
MEPLNKFFTFFSIFGIILIVSNCTHSKHKDLTLESEKKGFQKANCFFTEQKSLKTNSDFGDKYSFAPYISCKIENKEHIHFFEKNYMHYEIKDAYKVPNSKVFFAVFDYGIEGGLEKVPLLKSIDDGKSWVEISQLKKPHFSATIKEIKFTSPLKGRIEFEFEDKKILRHLNLAED